MNLWNKIVFGAVFSFITGWSDAVCVARYDTFATMMTGNLFLVGSAIANAISPPEGDEQVAWHYYLAVVLCYISGAFFYRAVERKSPHRAGMICAPILAIMMIPATLKGESRWDLCILAPMFAVQNAVSVRGKLGLGFTSMVTSQFWNLGIALAALVTGECNREKCNMPLVQVVMISSLLVGAVSGIVVTYYTGWAIRISIFVQALVLMFHDFVFAPKCEKPKKAEDSEETEESQSDGARAEEVEDAAQGESDEDGAEDSIANAILALESGILPGEENAEQHAAHRRPGGLRTSPARLSGSDSEESA